MLEQQLIDEFAGRLRAEVGDRLAETDADDPYAADVALAEVMLGYMEEAGLVTNSSSSVAVHCPSFGRG